MVHRLSRRRFKDDAVLAALRAKDQSFFDKLKIPRDELEKVQIGLVGTLVFPGDATYEADRQLFNPLFNPFPSLIIYCLTEEDVRLAVNLGWGHHLPVTIRSGGHCTAGYSGSSGLMIDVSGINDVSIHKENMIATVFCGANFGKLNSALQGQGVHIPVGECDDVCMGGFMQGGGYGFTSRTFGIHSDNVFSIRMVLADGRVVNANEEINRDLYWAVRGGTGGNFGVLISAAYQLQMLGDVYGWGILWPLAQASDRQTAAAALTQMQTNFFRTAPPEFNIQISVCYQPVSTGSSTVVPQLLVRGLYVGSQAAGRAAIQPLLQIPGAVFQYDVFADFITVDNQLLNYPYDIPYLQPNLPMPNEDKQARYVARDLTLAEWQAQLDFFVTSPNLYSYLYLEIYGGAINSYPVEGSAFIHRDVAFNACLDVFWYPGDNSAPVEKYLQDWCTLMQPVWNGHIYQNYPSGAVPDYRSNYWGQALDALVAVKNKYDPRGFFQFPQVISAYPNKAAAKTVTWPPKVAQALAQPIVYEK
jgi:FAD/FMN-containing dehydrogenase